MSCKNCNTTLHLDFNFCPECGAKVIRNRLTLKNLFSHFSEQFLNYDNKFIQTFLHLFSKPEVVIGGYISGVRKKYVNVISYFAIAITIAGLQMYILNKFFPEAVDISTISTEGSEAFQEKNMQFIQEYQSLLMMLYVPIYALMSRIVFFDKKTYNYTEHFVIFMYAFAQLSIISAMVMIIAAYFGETIGSIAFTVTLPMQLIYSAYCLKRLFKISVLAIFVRTLFFLLVLSVTFLFCSIAIAGILFLTGDLQELIEAQDAARSTALNHLFLHKLNLI